MGIASIISKPHFSLVFLREAKCGSQDARDK